ncbi:methyltransferase domain-containing [Pyrenophora seminiperda CCB06]|uniref:Methyltransferase domain-containing n=1 Tax=Pyrenophora seminiperda CCB06 TaxID=1302712 RepID=A0A3M7M5W1_9PLEO|nr:methyltransferase domain-containing [Pyrenophora seminiperda CCB06]
MTLFQLGLTSALSAYGLLLSYQNITRLQQYEAKSEKAAEWSNTAAHMLHKTRTTQASGTVTLLTSLLTSTALILLPGSGSQSSSSSILITASVANSITLYLARVHMANFWNDSKQTRIPFVEGYNEAIRGSELVVLLLGTLCLAWGAAGLVWAGMAYFGGWSGVLGLGVWGVVVGGRVVGIAGRMGWV